MVTTERATALYFRLAMGEKLTPKERAELDEYAARFKTKEIESEELLKDL